MVKRFTHRDAKIPPKKTRMQREADERRAQMELSWRTTCKHLNLKNFDQVCELGVDIRAHVGGPDRGWGRRMPCRPDSPLCDKTDLVPCKKYEPPSKEEYEEAEREIQESVAKTLSGISPCCDAPLEHGRSGWQHCSKCKRVVAHAHRRG